MKNSERGILITFEGLDGCGKTTQAKRLYQQLKRDGYPVLLIREPGGTAVSEKIRKILLDPAQEISPITELLLYEAARSQLVDEIILPQLVQGKIIICDRFFDSTTAYQGYGRRLDKNLITRLNRAASQTISPDITFIFDVDYATSLKRRGKKPDRLENEKRAFFNRVRRGFKEISGRRRCRFWDGREPIDSLAAAVLTATLQLLRRKRFRHV